MIKLIFCLRRRADMSREQFQTYWREIHAPLVAEVSAALRIRKYVQSHSFDDPRIAGMGSVRGMIDEPYDGVAELYWDSIEDVLVDNAAARDAGRRLLEDEAKFIDLPRSPLFWAREHHVI